MLSFKVQSAPRERSNKNNAHETGESAVAHVPLTANVKQKTKQTSVKTVLPVLPVNRTRTGSEMLCKPGTGRSSLSLHGGVVLTTGPRIAILLRN